MFSYINKSFHLLNVCLAALVITFVSCDSEGMDNEYTRANYEKVLQQIVTPEGESRFPASHKSEVILMGCESTVVAEGLVSALTLQKYEGNSSIILDLGEFGKVTATRSEESSGKFFYVEVDIKGSDRLRLLLASMDYFNLTSQKKNDGEFGITFGYVYKCPQCGACYTYIPEECLNCKYKDIDVPLLSIIPIPFLGIDEVDVNFDMEIRNNK